MSRRPGGRLPLLSTRPAVTPATLKRTATNFAAWWTETRWVWTVCLRLLHDSVAAAIWTRALFAWVQHANHSATEPPWLYIAKVKVNDYSARLVLNSRIPVRLFILEFRSVHMLWTSLYCLQRSHPVKSSGLTLTASARRHRPTCNNWFVVPDAVEAIYSHKSGSYNNRHGKATKTISGAASLFFASRRCCAISVYWLIGFKNQRRM